MTSLAKTLPIAGAAALAVLGFTLPAQAETDIWPTLKQQAFGDRPIQAEDGAVVLELPATAEDAALVPLTVRVPPHVKQGLKTLTLFIDKNPDPKIATPTLDRALAFVACRAAIKANTPLAPEEMERLVADLETTETPYFCPHGRPIVSRVSMHDIRRELKRTW